MIASGQEQHFVTYMQGNRRKFFRMSYNFAPRVFPTNLVTYPQDISTAQDFRTTQYNVISKSCGNTICFKSLINYFRTKS